MTRQFLLFIIVGSTAAGVNFLSRILLNEITSFRWAVVYAYIIGMLTAYILSRTFVFDRSGKSPTNELFWFSVVNVAAIIQVWCISVGLAEYLFPFINFEWYAQEMAHGLGLAVPVVTSYFGHRYFSFKKMQREDAL